MNSQPILSLCIPTNGAVKWVLPVLDSIYKQNYNLSKYEVVITDNGKDSKLASYLKDYNYANLRYIQTNDEGFLNLVTSLKKGRGLFCKMINHRSILVDGAIEKMVMLVEQYKENQPIIYCSSGQINKPEIVECKNVDELVQNLSYWCSWSAGIGFWQKDIEQIEKVELDKMFPNTSLLLNLRFDSQYVIWNYPYQIMEDDEGKGGYDLFDTFGVKLLDILNELRIQERISIDTFILVKEELFGFLKYLFFKEVTLPTKHTFIIHNIKKSMAVYYGANHYWEMLIGAKIRKPVHLFLSAFKALFRKK